MNVRAAAGEVKRKTHYGLGQSLSEHIVGRIWSTAEHGQIDATAEAQPLCLSRVAT